MLTLLRLLLSGRERRALACRIYPPGVPMEPAELQCRSRVIVVIELPDA